MWWWYVDGVLVCEVVTDCGAGVLVYDMCCGIRSGICDDSDGRDGDDQWR